MSVTQKRKRTVQIESIIELETITENIIGRVAQMSLEQAKAELQATTVDQLNQLPVEAEMILETLINELPGCSPKLQRYLIKQSLKKKIQLEED